MSYNAIVISSTLLYSGSGALKDKGMGKGKYYAINVPLQDGVQDESYCHIFERFVCRTFVTNTQLFQVLYKLM